MINLIKRKPLMILVGSLILFQVIFSDRPGHFYKHLGGFLSGFCLGFCLCPVYQNPELEMMKIEPEKMDKNQKIMCSISIAIYVSSLVFLVFLI